jgi:hypothetical protein
MSLKERKEPFESAAVVGGDATGLIASVVEESIVDDIPAGEGEGGISAICSLMFGCLQRRSYNERIQRVASFILLGILIFDRLSTILNVGLNLNDRKDGTLDPEKLLVLLMVITTILVYIWIVVIWAPGIAIKLSCTKIKSFFEGWRIWKIICCSPFILVFFFIYFPFYFFIFWIKQCFVAYPIVLNYLLKGDLNCVNDKYGIDKVNPSLANLLLTRASNSIF